MSSTFKYAAAVAVLAFASAPVNAATSLVNPAAKLAILNVGKAAVVPAAVTPIAAPSIKIVTPVLNYSFSLNLTRVGNSVCYTSSSIFSLSLFGGPARTVTKNSSNCPASP